MTMPLTLPIHNKSYSSAFISFILAMVSSVTIVLDAATLLTRMEKVSLPQTAHQDPA